METYSLFIIFVSATVVFGNFSRYVIIPGSRVTNALWTKVRQAGNAAECCLLCDEYPNCTAVNTYASPDTKPTANAIATQTSAMALGAAENAIDGNTGGDYFAGSCTSTMADPENWWMVEFQTVYSVTAVVIWNRIDTNVPSLYERLRDLTVYVAASSERMGHNDTICAAYTGPPSSSSDNPIQIDCQRTMYGRFLKIHKTTDGEWLTLCEVEIIQ